MSVEIKSFELSDPLTASLKGFADTNPNVELILKEKIIFRNTEKDKVALISGGGCGHEPTHAGFVGKGCLSAAVCGDIFASPSTKQILNAIKIVSKNSNGVLLIVKNYTGDVLHFGLAAERARALGINCSVAVIGDDVAVGRNKGGLVGRRALAGTTLVHKIVGAFAEKYSGKYGLDGVSKVAQVINENLVTIGSSLDHCKVPGRPFETELNEKQMEVGMGIHNEPGVQVLDSIPPLEQLIEKYMLPKLLDSEDEDRHFVSFDKKDEVVLLVNNLGGVSNFILTAIVDITKSFLQKNYDITPVQSICGTLMTSFNGNGFSITLFNASKSSGAIKKEFSEVKSVLDLLNDHTEAPAWPIKDVEMGKSPTYDEGILEDVIDVKKAGTYDFEKLSELLKAGADQLIKSEPHITHLDNQVGDGDCGYTLVAGAKAITENLDKISSKYLSQTLAEISDHIESAMGGTSGGLYSIFISGLSKGIIEQCGENDAVDKEAFAKSLEVAYETLCKYTRARPGDSTMIDALEPFVKEFSSTQDFHKAFSKAEGGAESTGNLEAKFGRASYVEDTEAIPDPGAIGLVEFLRGVDSKL
ncbi:dihydroxyacetone kinase [Kluyveromyces lactis]|uniref:KLLA0B04884p n=1 Tax=Kluyveromyces lactis (strain ATCC 8585 / CBS 2359 / DSM 70799 / NBRC 1267 / NRRL Y-1140 / WM37) TaxID=284590 RepID=Q6CWD8_KLULA|nr:uncharacterized protein KLLA0_B04884g [Kluyveromyces lactis]CAH02144.1 KLLA0B04884p [Kluyveromyces lactis]|eukprot:XP_451751.1 uncharacterized protein KLLA0_B04884g [Kluyveromyces lactis]